MSTTTAKLKEHLRLSEGYEQRLYKCPADKWTIGYGFNLEDRGIPREVAEFWMEYELLKLDQELRKSVNAYFVTDQTRRMVLLDMAYNMGVPRLKSFKKMLHAVWTSDFDKAADEMLDSKWARQVKGRAQKLSEIMRTGIWP